MHFVTELFGDAERVLQMAVYAAPETVDDEVGEKMEEDFDAMSLFKLITDCLEESAKKTGRQFNRHFGDVPKPVLNHVFGVMRHTVSDYT